MHIYGNETCILGCRMKRDRVDTISITDKGGFPKRVDAVKQASAGLRAIDTELEKILISAREEAKSSTTTGEPAPVYAPILDGLSGWREAVKKANAVVCDSAENCAATMSDKFTKITGKDADTANAIVAV